MRGIDALIADTARRYGIDPGAMRGIAQIESGLRPGAQNPSSSAGGLFQFIDSTWRQYGHGNKLDPAANTDAAGRYLSDVRSTLAKALGRAPTPGELYLGHQQGAGGAAKILSNPGAPAAMTVGTKAVLLNGGRQDMSNAEFANLWRDRLAKAMGQPVAAGAVNGAAPPVIAAPASPMPVAPPSLGDMFVSGLATMQQRKPKDDAVERARRLALLTPVE